MKKKRKILLGIFSVLLVAGGIVAAFAAVETQTGIKNTVNTGGISIDIDTFIMDNGNVVPLKEKTVIDREKDVSYIPRIKNNAEDCYIRVSLSAVSGTSSVDLMKNLTGVSNEWMKAGDFLYYAKPLDHDQTVDVCDGFHIPANWDYMKSNDLLVKITADAIQKKNFEPDFSAENPWGEVEVASSVVGDDYTINTVDPSETKGNIKVVYANAVDGITINTDDFFSDVNFMPGDEFSDSLSMSNQTKKTATILFKTEFKKSPLLDMMQLEINNGSTFYSGPMASEKLSDYQKIATLKPGETKKIEVDLALPASADNTYQVNSDQVKWFFAIEQDNEKGFIKTADAMPLWIISLLMLAATAGLVLLARRKRNDETM